MTDYQFHAYPNNEHDWYNKSIDHFLFIGQPTPVETADVHSYMNAKRTSILKDYYTAAHFKWYII